MLRLAWFTNTGPPLVAAKDLWSEVGELLCDIHLIHPSVSLLEYLF